MILPPPAKPAAPSGHGFGLRWAQDRVREFHLLAGQPAPAYPTAIPGKRLETRRAWMLEELEELDQATTLVDQADALIDLIYFALGTLVEMGIDGERFFDIVHRANLSKVATSSSRVTANDGKVEKPSDWISPELEMANQLAQEVSRFSLITAPDTASSLPACLMMAAAALGLSPPPPNWSHQTPRNDGGSPSTGSASADAFVGPSGSFTDLFRRSGLPLADEYTPWSMLDEATFSDDLARSIATFPATIVAFDSAAVYRRDESQLHWSLVISVLGSRVTILDPSPSERGISNINVDDLLVGMRMASQGIHNLVPNGL